MARRGRRLAERAGLAAPIWVYRLPSLIGGVGAGLLTWWLALAFGRPRAALLAGVLMAANVVLVGEARLARGETVLLAAIVLAEGALARLWLAAEGKRRPLLAMLFWWGWASAYWCAVRSPHSLWHCRSLPSASSSARSAG